MQNISDLESLIAGLGERLESKIEARFDAIETKLAKVVGSRQKSLEWVGMLAEQIRSLDDFREEVRAGFEPLLGKLDNLDEVMRILRHATSDVSRRVENLERGYRKAG